MEQGYEKTKFLFFFAFLVFSIFGFFHIWIIFLQDYSTSSASKENSSATLTNFLLMLNKLK